MHEIGNLSTASVMTRVLFAMTIGGLAGYERHQRHNFLVVTGMAALTAGATSFLLLARHLAIFDSIALSLALQTSMLVISLICVGIIWAGGVSAHTIRTAAVIWTIGAVGLTLATDIWWLGLLLGFVTIGVIYLTIAKSRTIEPNPDGSESHNVEKMHTHFRTKYGPMLAQLQPPALRVRGRPRLATQT